MKQFGLNKHQKIKHKKEIEALFEAGNMVKSFPLRCVFNLKNVIENDNAEHYRIAVSVSKKLFKNATDRNRIKRLLREAIRLNKTNLYTYLEQNKLQLNAFYFYTSNTEISFVEINKLVLKVNAKLIAEMPEISKT
jgi:ribonuclease P protein component